MAKRKKKLIPSQPDLRLGTEVHMEAALSEILSGSLALYILCTSKKPLSEVAHELMNMEVKAAQFVSALTSVPQDILKLSALRGSLAGALSFIPFSKTQTEAIQKRPDVKKQNRSPRGRRVAMNKELKGVFDYYNSLDHSGKSVRAVTQEIGQMIGVVMRKHLDHAMTENASSPIRRKFKSKRTKKRR